MKKNLFFIGAFIALFYSCKKENNVQEEPKLAPPQTKSVAITDPNDVNLNVNWKWYDPAVQNVTLYFGQKVNNQPVPGVQAPLPWFVFGNPINNADKDYRPELGWTLYLRDFGTPNRPAQTPFFALYNKYSGVLRFFVYNYRVRNQGEASKTYYIGELGFTSPSNSSGMLSFFAPMSQFSSDKIDPNLKQMVVSKKNSSDSWINLDFTLINGGGQLSLNVYGANETELALGTDFSTLSAKSSVGASGGGTSGFSNFINRAYEYVSSGTSFLESIDKFQDKIEEGKAKPEPDSVSTSQSARARTFSLESNSNVAPQAISIGTVAAGVGVVKSFLGVVKTFFGGTKSATNTQTTIQYSGMVKTNGTATMTNNLYSIQFDPNYNLPLSAQYYIPLFKKPVGLIDIVGGGTYDAHIVTEDNFFPNCYTGLTASMGYVRYYLTKELFNNIYPLYYNSNNTIRLDTINLMLYNNMFFGSEYEYERNNSLLFLMQAEHFPYRYNKGINFLSENFGWKRLYPFTSNESDIVNLGSVYYSGSSPTLYNIDRSRLPKYLAIELKYTITDPNYPLPDSRERVIYKVVQLDTRLIYNPNRNGCAINPS